MRKNRCLSYILIPLILTGCGSIKYVEKADAKKTVHVFDVSCEEPYKIVPCEADTLGSQEYLIDGNPFYASTTADGSVVLIYPLYSDAVKYDVTDALTMGLALKKNNYLNALVQNLVMFLSNEEISLIEAVPISERMPTPQSWNDLFGYFLIFDSDVRAVISETRIELNNDD